MNVEERLRNWGRVYRSPMTQHSCGSAEKHYRSNYRQWIPLHDIHYPVPVDMQDAEIIEQAWRKMLGKPKLLLKYWYTTSFPDVVVCRKSKIKLYEFHKELMRAKNYLTDILESDINAGNLSRASEMNLPQMADLSLAETA